MVVVVIKELECLCTQITIMYKELTINAES